MNNVQCNPRPSVFPEQPQSSSHSCPTNVLIKLNLGLESPQKLCRTSESTTAEPRTTKHNLAWHEGMYFVCRMGKMYERDSDT